MTRRILLSLFVSFSVFAFGRNNFTSQKNTLISIPIIHRISQNIDSLKKVDCHSFPKNLSKFKESSELISELSKYKKECFINMTSNERIYALTVLVKAKLADNSKPLFKFTDTTYSESDKISSKIFDTAPQGFMDSLIVSSISADSSLKGDRHRNPKLSNLLFDFIGETGIISSLATDDSVLLKAKRWQGAGNYPGVDAWEVFEISANTKLYGGLPGQSEFYSVEKSLLDVNYDKVKYWESLQVAPHPTFGFRPKVGEYTVNTIIKVAVSKTLANPQFGKGGGWQVFVDDYTKKITFVKEIPLK